MEFKLDEQMAEFCGILLGDGNLWTNGRKYEVTITGSPKDRGYMNYILRYTTKKLGQKAYYRIRGRGLRISIYSKKMFKFLTTDAKIESGMKKAMSGTPQWIFSSKRFSRAFIRGVFDTDGSIFTSRKKE